MSHLIHAQRSERLRAAMGDAGLDLLIVAGDSWRSDYVRYVADVTPLEGQAFALVERSGGLRLLTDSRAEARRVAVERTDLSVSWAVAPVAEVESAIGALAGGRAALAPASATPRRLAAGPLGHTIPSATALLDRLMLRKSPLELAAVGQAARLADAGYRTFRDAATPGQPEYALVAEVEGFLRARGCVDNFQILGSGGQEVRGMHPPGERRLARGDLVTTELTPCVDGYYAQICRTLVLGPASEAQHQAFSVFLEALEAGVAAVRPGTTAADVARAQNEVFRRHGLGRYVTSEYTRVRGHGVGLYPDARPSILEDVGLVLEPGMTLIVHPNTYHPVVGYMVLGDTVRVTEGGCEVLCKTPRELFCVPCAAD